MNDTPKTDKIDSIVYRDADAAMCAHRKNARELESENTRMREALEIIASGDTDARRRAEDALG